MWLISCTWRWATTATPSEVSPLLPTTEEERQRWEAGRQRRAERLDAQSAGRLTPLPSRGDGIENIKRRVAW